MIIGLLPSVTAWLHEKQYRNDASWSRVLRTYKVKGDVLSLSHTHLHGTGPKYSAKNDPFPSITVCPKATGHLGNTRTHSCSSIRANAPVSCCPSEGSPSLSTLRRAPTTRKWDSSGHPSESHEVHSKRSTKASGSRLAISIAAHGELHVWTQEVYVPPSVTLDICIQLWVTNKFVKMVKHVAPLPSHDFSDNTRLARDQSLSSCSTSFTTLAFWEKLGS